MLNSTSLKKTLLCMLLQYYKTSFRLKNIDILQNLDISCSSCLLRAANIELALRFHHSGTVPGTSLHTFLGCPSAIPYNIMQPTTWTVQGLRVLPQCATVSNQLPSTFEQAFNRKYINEMLCLSNEHIKCLVIHLDNFFGWPGWEKSPIYRNTIWIQVLLK